jgi:hypothetical protein
MADLWLKISCFFTGYNYQIVKNSSELASKMVKKNMSALILISMLWAFIGFNFTARYLHGSIIASTIVALIMIIVVIQIERQILMSLHSNKGGLIIRALIGVIMAIIGSFIVDQIIFKDDVEQYRMAAVQDRINNILPIKTMELKGQIVQIAKAIDEKESERNALLEELGRKPTITTPTSVGKYEKDSTGKMVMVRQEVTYQSVPNPKANIVTKIDEQLAMLRNELTKKEDLLLNIRADIEKEVKNKTGFLDEVGSLYKIVVSSGLSTFIWLLFFLFFLFWELFILFNKINDKETDYEIVLLHQMETRKRKIKEIEKN